LKCFWWHVFNCFVIYEVVARGLIIFEFFTTDRTSPGVVGEAKSAMGSDEEI